MPNSSFYVTLMSHASTREFPENKAHHFRNRLPQPIRFVGRGWMVGMVSLSLPTIPVVGENFMGNTEPLLYVRWHERVYAKTRGRCLVASTSRTHSKGSRHERLLVLVDGRSIVSPSGVPLRARTCAANPTPQQMGGEQWRQVVPDLLMDLGRGFGVEYRQCGLQSSSGARVMGQNLGPENGMNRTSVDGRVSPGTQYITRISFGLDSHADGCPERRQQAYLLESGWGLYGVECQLQLAVCEFERPISSLVGISCDASLARVLRCRHQQHGRGSHHGSLARNQVPPSKHHTL